MKWDHLSLLRRALTWAGIGSAALVSSQSLASLPSSGTDGAANPREPEPLTFERPNHNDGLELFAAHSSHASHASHSSHSSHYSGSGAGYVPSPPQADPTLVPPPRQVAPPIVPPSALLNPFKPAEATPEIAPPPPPAAVKPAQATQQDKKLMVLRVQAQLRQLGYYMGTIDGQIGGGTKDALTRYQMVKGLPSTGAMDDATLSS